MNTHDPMHADDLSDATNESSAIVSSVASTAPLIGTTLMELEIHPELASYLRPLHALEKELLFDSLRKEGCRDPIVYVEFDGKKFVADGHHRYPFCRLARIPFKTEKLDASSVEEVKAWMLNTQFARRNATKAERDYSLGLLYNHTRKRTPDVLIKLTRASERLLEASRIAGEHINEKTWSRHGKFADDLDKLANLGAPELKAMILSHEVRFRRERLSELFELDRDTLLALTRHLKEEKDAKSFFDKLGKEPSVGVEDIAASQITPPTAEAKSVGATALHETATDPASQPTHPIAPEPTPPSVQVAPDEDIEYPNEDMAPDCDVEDDDIEPPPEPYAETDELDGDHQQPDSDDEELDEEDLEYFSPDEYPAPVPNPDSLINDALEGLEHVEKLLSQLSPGDLGSDGSLRFERKLEKIASQLGRLG